MLNRRNTVDTNYIAASLTIISTMLSRLSVWVVQFVIINLK